MTLYSHQMASYDRVSFMEQSTSITLLHINLTRNMIGVLDPFKYSHLVQPLIVDLDLFMLKIALIMFEHVPISKLPTTSSTGIYNKKL